MSLLPKSIHRCRRYPTKFNSGRDIPAFEPEVLKTYAKHYETGEVIPQELIDKLKKATHFNQGFATVGYLAGCFLDLDLHTLTEAKELDLEKFETETMNKIGLLPEIGVRYRSTYSNISSTTDILQDITATYGPRFLMPMPLKYLKRQAFLTKKQHRHSGRTFLKEAAQKIR